MGFSYTLILTQALCNYANRCTGSYFILVFNYSLFFHIIAFIPTKEGSMPIRYGGSPLHLKSRNDIPVIMISCHPEFINFKSSKSTTSHARHPELVEGKNPRPGKKTAFPAMFRVPEQGHPQLTHIVLFMASPKAEFSTLLCYNSY